MCTLFSIRWISAELLFSASFMVVLEPSPWSKPTSSNAFSRYIMDFQNPETTSNTITFCEVSNKFYSIGIDAIDSAPMSWFSIYTLICVPVTRSTITFVIGFTSWTTTSFKLATCGEIVIVFIYLSHFVFIFLSILYRFLYKSQYKLHRY